jgi:3-isopropylmalate/(R)-2-methylmalate dehydratase small subunit
MKITGHAWKMQRDDINTDQIRRSIYANLPLDEQAKHCLETIDPTFASKVKRGDILVAGKNFGAGSSRPAHATLMALGLAGIVADSFSRIFFRNSISGGLLVTPCPGICDIVDSGNEIEVDTVAGRVRNLTTGRELDCPPLPPFLRGMVECGGEKPYIKARLAAMAGAA